VNDVDEINELLSPLARVRPKPGERAFGAGAQALLALTISQEPGTEATVSRRAHQYGFLQRRPRRLALGLSAAVVIAMGVVAGPSLLEDGRGGATSYANSAVEVRRVGDQYVGRIKDPRADNQRFSQAFHAVGLNVELRVVPVSPTAVGKIISMSPGAEPGQMVGVFTEPRDCDLADSGCFMVVSVPAAMVGKPETASFDLGRPAEPGERYANELYRATGQGEELAGVNVSGRPVAEVMAEVRKRHLAAEFSLVVVYSGGMTFKPLTADQVGPDWIIWDVNPAKAGVVRLAVSPKRLAGLEYRPETPAS
jgi:hypothetical protein